MSDVTDRALLGMSGKRAVVAGSGRGIGRAVALRLASAGARVLCVDLDADRAAQIARDIVSAGGDAVGIEADLLLRDRIESVVDEARRVLGGVDVLADVVGHAGWGRVLDMDEDVWHENFAVNVRQSYLLTQVFGRELVAQQTGGAIVHVVSLIKTASLELGPAGIRINGVAPGAVDTLRVEALMSQAYWDELRATIPLRRQAAAQDIGDAALFLLSDLASYVTGHVLVVDGGVSARLQLPEPVFAGAGSSGS
jgi:NAD(P)-dependent dehydrogenase (short-subunit alcohol dehydrogenase family)